MSIGNYTHTTRATGTVLTATIYNGDHQNHITNQNPSGTGSYSDNVSQMQAVTDPGEEGTESLAGSLAGELERLRFAIKDIKTFLAATSAQWYSTPTGNVTLTNMANTKQTLTDGANIAWNLALGGHATVTLGGNRTLDAPTNIKTGGIYVLTVIQDGTGSRTLTWNATYRGLYNNNMPQPFAGPGLPSVYVFICPDGFNLRLIASPTDQYVQAGAAVSHIMPVGGIINVNTTVVGNIGTGTDDLMSFTLLANALSANAKGLRITAWGKTANNANAKTLAFEFGSANVVLNPALTTSQASAWRADIVVLRTGSNAQDILAQISEEPDNTFGTAGKMIRRITTATQTDTAGIIMKFTGAATADNDITQEGMLIEFIN